MIGGSGDGRIDKAEKTPREVRAILEKAADVLARRIADPVSRRVCNVELIIDSAVQLLLYQKLTTQEEHKKAVLERVKEIAEEQGISPESLTAIHLDDAHRLVTLTLRSLKR